MEKELLSIEMGMGTAGRHVAVEGKGYQQVIFFLDDLSRDKRSTATCGVARENRGRESRYLNEEGGVRYAGR